MAFDCDCNHYYEKNAQLQSTHTSERGGVCERAKEREREKHCKLCNLLPRVTIRNKCQEKRSKKARTLLPSKIVRL